MLRKISMSVLFVNIRISKICNYIIANLPGPLILGALKKPNAAVNIMILNIVLKRAFLLNNIYIYIRGVFDK